MTGWDIHPHYWQQHRHRYNRNHHCGNCASLWSDRSSRAIKDVTLECPSSQPSNPPRPPPQVWQTSWRRLGLDQDCYISRVWMLVTRIHVGFHLISQDFQPATNHVRRSRTGSCFCHTGLQEFPRALFVHFPSPEDGLRASHAHTWFPEFPHNFYSQYPY